MTERIYYTDPECRTFEAVVQQSFEHEGRPAVLLDRTAFYPTSGGQPFDTGQLGDAHVENTIDREGDIVHLLNVPLDAGSRVHGAIDWTRRFDHMQQHTGQHVLSAAFDRLFDNRTVSFHMGADLCTIDLAKDTGASDVERAVDLANEIVWENRPVAIRFASDADASSLPLRKESARQGTLRLIDITDFDLSACGGTHVSRTGAIGLIAVLACERFRSGSRVTFVCGRRALNAMRTYRDAVTGSIRVLSVLPQELPSAVERVQSDAKDLRKTLGRLQIALAGHEAMRLLDGAETMHHVTGDTDVRVIAQVVDGWDAPGLKSLATALGRHERVAAILVSSFAPALVFIVHSTGDALDARQILRQLNDRFGGKGGGSKDLAQGGGLSADPQAIVLAARELLTASMNPPAA